MNYAHELSTEINKIEFVNTVQFSNLNGAELRTNIYDSNGNTKLNSKFLVSFKVNDYVLLKSSLNWYKVNFQLN